MKIDAELVIAAQQDIINQFQYELIVRDAAIRSLLAQRGDADE